MKKSKYLWLIMIGFMLVSAGAVFAGGSAEKEAAEKEGITITYTRSKDSTKNTADIVALCESENPNIKVNVQEMPSGADSMHNAFVTALSAGDSSVDVYRLDTIWGAEFSSAGWLLPIDKYISAGMMDDFIDEPLKAFEYQGKLFAVPHMNDIGLLYYRKDLVPEPPETWSELIEISRSLIADGKAKYGIVHQAAQYEGMVCDVLEVIHGNGGAIIDKNNNVVIDSPKTLEALQIFKELLSIAPQGVTTYKESESLNVFIDGDTVFHRNWPYAWSVSNKGEESKIQGKVGIAPVPRGQKGDHGAGTLGAMYLGVNNYSKNPDAAWKFIESYVSLEGQIIQAKYGRIPVIKSAFQNEEVLKMNPHFVGLDEILGNGAHRPVTPFYPKVSEILQIYIHQYLTDMIDAQTAIDKMEEEIAAVIE